MKPIICQEHGYRLDDEEILDAIAFYEGVSVEELKAKYSTEELTAMQMDFVGATA